VGLPCFDCLAANSEHTLEVTSTSTRLANVAPCARAWRADGADKGLGGVLSCRLLATSVGGQGRRVRVRWKEDSESAGVCGLYTGQLEL
jgi:hypothetical protein